MQIQNSSNKKKTLDKALIIIASITIIMAILTITAIVLNNAEIQFFEQKGNKIKESYLATENNTWDISENGDGSVVATLSEDGTLTISGTGKMKVMNSLDTTVWYEVKDRIKSVIIEEGVTNISDGAFGDCRNLTSIEIPHSVISIGIYAFTYCESLTSIKIPNSVTSIGNAAFAYCESLTSIEIPNSVTDIGYSAFYGCKVFKKVDKFNNDSGIIDILKRLQDNSDILYAGNSGMELRNCTIDGNTIQIIDKNSWAEINVLEGPLEGLTFITFDNLIWDISENGDRSVVATLVEDGTLTISGIGNMKDWENTAHTAWYEIRDKVKSVIIEKGVTSIGKRAFSQCASLISIEIPNSVINIGDRAFYECRSLTTIKIPNSVISIGESAFETCTSLTNIIIPDSVTSIANNLFAGAASLTNIEIPENVTSIGRNAFCGCGSLTNIEIPNSVTTIDDGAFSGCTSLTSITIPNSVISIGRKAFGGCTSLTRIEIPDSVTSIGDYVFSQCTSLTSIEIDKENKNYMDDNGVLYTKDGSEIIKYPEGKKETTYTILTGTKNIRDDAFSRCTSLKSIEIPDSVTSIGSEAFYKSTSLTNIIIPDSVTSIGRRAFEECISLKSIEMPNGITSIGDFAFYKCTSLTNIIIPDSVTYIGWCAFDECISLTNIEIPNSVTSIGDGAFSGCVSLTIIKIPNSVTNIGGGVFTGCTSLTSIEINKENKNYMDDNGVLYTKNGSEIIKYPEGKKETLYTILNGATSIRDGAFYGCTSLTNIEIPNGLTNIGSGAFSECINLTSIVIPDSVTNIEFEAFYRCTSLTSIEIPNSVTSIGNYAFKECASLTNIEIPDSVTDIGWEAFSECISLTSIEIPNSVTSINRYAFCGCTNLTRIVIPNSVTNIGISVFFRCPNLTIYCKKDSNAEQYAINNDIEYVIDDEPPTITSVVGNPTEWTNKDVTLTINAEDSVVGLAKKPYSFDGGTTWQAENTKTYTENTEGIIIKVKDKLDNIYTHETIDITKIEKQDSTWDISENGDGSVVATLSDDGILTISGTGKMKDWGNSDSTDWYEVKDKVKSVIIEEGVSSIGWYAFSKCTNLTSVKIPNSVTDIGHYTFEECTSLASIKIPNSVTRTGIYTFLGCTSLTSIEIPNSVTNIDGWAFMGCTNLTSVEIPNSVTRIELMAFIYCKSLISIKIPNSVTFIGDYVFDGCTSLTRIEVDEANKNYMDDNGVLYTKNGSEIIRCPEGKKETIYTILTGVTSIRDNAFYKCTGLTNIEIPNSVINIHGSVFNGCTSLTRIDVDEANKNYMDDNGVLYIKDGSEIIKYPEGKKETIYTILTGVTSIGDNAFYGCTGLTSMDIPNSVTNIKGNAFYECTSLTKIVIPDSVTNIGNAVFSSRTSRPNLTIYCTSDSYAKQYAIDNSVQYVIDDDAPITSITGNPTEWTNKDVTLTINAEDSVVGLAKKPYSFDGGTTWQAENTKTYTENTEGIIIIKVKDKLDNIYIHETIDTIKIDKQVPIIKTVKGNAPVWINANVKLTINAEDNLSGLYEKAYSFDGGATWQEENTKTYTENTSGIIIKVKDQAGNVTTYNEQIDITKIDKQAPTITSVVAIPKLLNEGIILTINAEDSLSGLNINPYSFDGGATWQLENTKIYTENTIGIVVKVKDKVGNIATHYEEINIDINTKLEVGFVSFEEKKEENNTYITNVTPETSMKEFLTNIKTNGTIEIYKGTEKITNTEAKIGTGMTVKIKLNQEQIEYTVVIKGDINGDGNVKLSDLSRLKLSIIGTTRLEGAYKYAADLNGDGNVKLSDLSKMKLHLVGNRSL